MLINLDDTKKEDSNEYIFELLSMESRDKTDIRAFHIHWLVSNHVTSKYGSAVTLRWTSAASFDTITLDLYWKQN